MFEFGTHSQFVVSLTLQDGMWVERQGLDDEPLKVGSRATYAFPDASTVVIQEACCGISRFHVDGIGTTFRLTYIDAEGIPALDRMAGHILFEDAPFTAVP
jgi:hypothetical protein